MIVNIVGAPCSGKSTLACSLFSKLKSDHHSAEYVAEYAKQLVWQDELDLLDNQYYVATQQYKMINSVHGKVDYLICDSPLFISLFYNEYNKKNVSDVQKTKTMILDRMKEFEDSMYIFIKRNKQNSYDLNGRVHTEKESEDIENLIQTMLTDMNIKYFEISTGDDITKIYDFITRKDDTREDQPKFNLWKMLVSLFI